MSDVEKPADIWKSAEAQMVKQTIASQLNKPNALTEALGLLGNPKGPATDPYWVMSVNPPTKLAPPLSKKHSLPGSVKCEVTHSTVQDVNTFHLSWSITNLVAVELGLTASWLEDAAGYIKAVVQQEFARMLQSKVLSGSYAHTYSLGAQLPVSAITSALQTKAWEPDGDGAEAPQVVPPPPQTEQG